MAHGGGALGIAVLTVAIRLVDLGTRERAVAFTGGAPEQEQAFGAETAPCVLRAEAALRQAQLEVGAAGHRVVALARVERPLHDAQRRDQLRNNEVRVRVTVAVQVAALVDGHAAQRELDVLAVFGVEAHADRAVGFHCAAAQGEMAHAQVDAREVEVTLHGETC